MIKADQAQSARMVNEAGLRVMIELAVGIPGFLRILPQHGQQVEADQTGDPLLFGNGLVVPQPSAEQARRVERRRPALNSSGFAGSIDSVRPRHIG
jgi:hypothetical protein